MLYLLQVHEVGRFDAGFSSDFDQFRRLEETPGLVQQGLLREVNDLIGIVVLTQQLIADFPGPFSHISCLVKNCLPGRICFDLMND